MVQNCRPFVAVNTLFMPCDPWAFRLFYSNIPQQPALMFYSSNEIAYEKVHHRILLTPIHQPAGSDVLAHATTSGLIMTGCLLFVCLSTAAEAFLDTGNRWWGGAGCDDIKDPWKLFRGGWPWCKNQVVTRHTEYTLGTSEMAGPYLLQMFRAHLSFITGSINLLRGSFCVCHSNACFTTE